MSEKKKVGEHYNSRPDLGKKRRVQSPILELRKFNNWVKSMLLREGYKYAGEKPTVLDMCCGKGGDMLKHFNAGAGHVYGYDIAEVSIEQARERLQNLSSGRGRTHIPRGFATYAAMDVFEKPVVLEGGRRVQLASCQFAMHYGFYSGEAVERFLDSVARYLDVGCAFVGTIPDEVVLAERLKAAPGPRFGNAIYSVEFDEPVPRALDAFGIRYSFTLVDAVENVPEYVVPFDLLVPLAEKFGLKLLWKVNFKTFFDHNKNRPAALELFSKLEFDPSLLSPDDWDAAELYQVFLFQKVRPCPPSTPPYSPPNTSSKVR